MNPFKIIWRWLRSLGQRRAVKQEIDEELRFHIEQRTAENIAAGMSSREAAREARKRFGNWQSVREECREKRGASFGEATLRDIRFGFRTLRKNPGFTAVAVLTLALGIGANTAIFSVFDAVLLKPLPYPNSERIVALTEVNKTGFTHAASFPNFLDYREQNTVLEETAGMSSTAYNLAGDGEPERVLAQNVTGGFFPLLGVKPLLGRWFSAEEDRVNAERVAIISHSLWQRRFSGNRDIIGRRIILDEQGCTIVGVMPLEFRSITGNFYQSAADAPAIWTPLATDATQSARYSWFLRIIGRLKPGVSIETAASEMSAIAGRLAAQFPENNAGYGIRVRGLHQDLVENSRPTAWLLTAAVALLLLVACANVANLFLLRSIARAGEMTIRSALGASRARIIRQLLTESVLVAVSGGVLGVFLGWLGINLLQHLLPHGPVSIHAAEMNFTVVTFTLAVSFATGVIFGLAPALHSTKVNLNDALRSAGKGTPGGRSRLRNSFVVAEIALSFMLLAGAGLVIKSLGQLLRVNPGFRAENVLAMRIQLPEKKYDESFKIRAFYDQLLARLNALPGVVSVGGITDLPMTGTISTTEFMIVGRPAPAPGDISMAGYQSVTTDYFHAMGMPLRKGRPFGEQDREGVPMVAAINQNMVATFWPNEDPIGKAITIGGTRIEIVGVVGDVLRGGLNTPVGPEIYLSHAQQGDRAMMLVVRAQANPTALSQGIRAQMAQLDPNVPLAEVRTLEAAVANTTSDSRTIAFLLGSFAFAALGLAALGLYGVISYSVANRTREIGIRIALGAQAGDVRNLVVKQGLRVVFGGVAIGIFASLASGRMLTNLLFEVKATDPLTFVIVSIVLVAVAVIALSIPARRAARVNPMVALRHE